MENGKTPLFAAIKQNNVDVAKALLKSGANANASLEDSERTSALLVAIELYAYSLDPTMVRVLLDGGADPNYKTQGQYHIDDDNPARSRDMAGQTALTKSAEIGSFVVTRMLLEHGADPHIEREDDDVVDPLPIDIARQKNNDEVAKLIEQYMSKAPR